MKRHVQPVYASQTEANRQYSGAINSLMDKTPYFGVISVSSDTNVSIQYGVWLVDATAGPVTLTVEPADPHEGLGWTFKKKDSSGNAVTISSASDIDGSSTYSLSSQYDSVTIVSDGSVWHVI